jgi:hypothetical protein
MEVYMDTNYIYLIIDDLGEVIDESCDKKEALEIFQKLVNDIKEDELPIEDISYSIVRFKKDKVIKKWKNT